MYLEHNVPLLNMSVLLHTGVVRDFLDVDAATQDDAKVVLLPALGQSDFHRWGACCAVGGRGFALNDLQCRTIHVRYLIIKLIHKILKVSTYSKYLLLGNKN